jgi:hypothetical protein
MADGGGGGFDGGGGGSGGGGGNSSGKIVELRIHSSRRRKVVWARFSACEDVEGPGPPKREERPACVFKIR